MKVSYLHLFGLILIGCGQYPNPNDLSSVQADQRVAIANKRLESAEATLQYKVEHNEISDSRRNELISELAEEFLKTIDPKVVPDSDQWMYAALLRVTNRWSDAEKSLKLAVKVAKSPDRQVNDNLKLAQAQAKNNEVSEAIATAHSITNAADGDAAPILPSVLLELIPTAQGKGHDRELADLLRQAVQCHMRVKVDMNSDAGKSFEIARHYHINKAEEKIVELLGSKT
jgi:hypothetical protein